MGFGGVEKIRTEKQGVLEDQKSCHSHSKADLNCASTRIFAQKSGFWGDCASMRSFAQKRDGFLGNCAFMRIFAQRSIGVGETCFYEIFAQTGVLGDSMGSFAQTVSRFWGTVLF